MNNLGGGQYYKASLGKGAHIVTVIVLVLFFVVMPFILLSLASVDEEVPVFFPYLLGVIFIIVVLVTYIYSPKGFEIRDGKLVILRPIGAVEHQLTDIAQFSIENGQIWKRMPIFRLFGSGGLF